jgi:hypothetical protein
MMIGEAQNTGANTEGSNKNPQEKTIPKGQRLVAFLR